MEAVLRVYGKKMDISGVSSLARVQPYRVDRDGVGRSKTNCLHYEVVPLEDLGFSSLLTKMMNFLKENEDLLLNVKSRSDLDGVVLDIGVTVPIDIFASSYEFPNFFLAEIAHLGLSVELSVYKESSSINCRVGGGESA